MYSDIYEIKKHCNRYYIIAAAHSVDRETSYMYHDGTLHSYCGSGGFMDTYAQALERLHRNTSTNNMSIIKVAM